MGESTDLARYSLTAYVGNAGAPTVIVNGTEVPGVAAASCYTARGEIPRLVLDIAGDVTIEGDGIVHTTMPADGDELAAWLENIDPDELSSAALANTSMGTSPGQAMLAQLVKMARAGQAPEATTDGQ